MSKNNLHRYWFLIVALAGLSAGLALESPLNTVAFAVDAAVGVALASKWTVDAIRRREFGSDSLAILAIIASAAINEWLAAAIISVMLASGRALEEWAAGNARRELHSLLNRAPAVATVVFDGGEQSIAVAEVAIGSIVRVLNGQVVPIDGQLLDGAVLDESALTGEVLPVSRDAGDEVSSGVLNAGSAFSLRTTSSYADSTYANLIRLVRQASAESASSVRLANRWAIWFIPVTLVLALGTWLITGQSHFAVAVLVAATPCPLILAVPVALISGMSKAAKRGVIIKGGDALEQLAGVRSVLFDKTGTLTHGGLRAGSMVFAEHVDPAKVMSVVAAVEAHSPHVVAKALIEMAGAFQIEQVAISEVTEDHGIGIRATVDGRSVRIGQPSGVIPEWAKLGDALLVAIEIDGQLQAMIGLDDPIREDANQTASMLRNLGVQNLALVSGDREEATARVAEQISADEYFAGCTPDRKLEILRAKQIEYKHHVASVGDGINDAPFLAGADVGIAMGARGSSAASEAADVVIVEDSIYRVAMAIDVAKGSFAKAMQAAGIGMGLALLAMVAASVGLLSPTASAIAQEAIDTAAVLWAITPLRSSHGNAHSRTDRA
ncbi:MAG: heavy metal translocating P-type ATPase [Micrococcales bacterium]